MTSYIPNYQIVEQIGQGCFGYVFKAWDATKKEYVAIKRIKKVSNVLSREFQCLFEMSNCNNVIRILDFYYSIHNGDKIQNIVFEYMNMNLHQFIQKMKKNNQILDELQFKGLAYQLLSGLAEMHEKNICHRDLKPENILIDSKGQLKICDLGSSKFLLSSINTPYVVTQYYRAPELILSHTNYTTSIDIWAVGCILLEVVLQQVFFEGEDEGDQFFKIIWKLGSPNNQEILYLFQYTPYRDYIISKIQNQSSKQRWIHKLFWMKDLNNFLNLIGSMLKYIDKERISAADALKHPYFNQIFY